MRIRKNQTYAVITGDIVSYSGLSAADRRAAQRYLKTGTATVRKAFSRAVPLDIGLFRGDGWQLIAGEPERALRIGLFLRAWLRGRMGSHNFDTRVAIGFGTIDFVPGDRVIEGDGAAYRRSGHALEALAGEERMALKVEAGDQGAIDTMIRLLDTIARGWSDKQALAIAGALLGWKQEKIGRSLWKKSISQQAVAQHLQRGGWNAVDGTVDFFEKRFNEQTQCFSLVS